MQRPNLVLRADADESVGAGHVSRCLALAQAWRDFGGEACLVGAVKQEWLREALGAEGVRTLPASGDRGSVTDGRHLTSVASDLDARWVVVDGYEFGAGYLGSVAESRQTLVVDDSAGPMEAFGHLVVNPNPFGSPDYYEPADRTILAGPAYALLRRPFAYPGPWPSPPSLLTVALGGGGDESTSQRVFATMRTLLSDLIPNEIEGVRLLASTTDPLSSMRFSKLSVTAAGVTALEFCSLGVPQILVSKESNQRSMAASLAGAGCGIDVGDLETLELEQVVVEARRLLVRPDLSARIGGAGMCLIDGQGAARVGLNMGIASLRLRPAKMIDAVMLLDWANDLDVRAASLQREPIGLPAHEIWLQEKLEDAGTLFLIAHDASDAPVGQVRFSQMTDSVWEIHLAVDSRRRGRGLGTEMILIGCRIASRVLGAHEVMARVRTENARSLGAFEAAGFNRSGANDEWVTMTSSFRRIH